MIEISKIIRTRRRTIALIIQPDGSLVVRAPLRTSSAAIARLVEQKSGWIRLKQAQMKASRPLQAPKKYADGEEFWYLGKQYKLEIVEAARPALSLDKNFRLSSAARVKAALVFERWYRQQAAQVLEERLRVYAARHGFTYKGMRITSARRRWGSCSARGSLNFTWRLVMAPLAVIDYVVVHELVHLQVKNHSKEFWRRVGEIMPDYNRYVEWLKANGHLLTLDE